MISRPDVWIDSCFTLHVSPHLPPLSFFTLLQDECNLCLWADMQNISFSFNGLINTSVHKVLTTFCSLNISVNPVFCFEFGWLSQHVVRVVSQCSPFCHQWGTWSWTWISFDFPKIWERFSYLWAHILRFVFLCFGFSGSETTASSGWQMCFCWGFLWKERLQWLNLKMLCHGGERRRPDSSNEGLDMWAHLAACTMTQWMTQSQCFSAYCSCTTIFQTQP